MPKKFTKEGLEKLQKELEYLKNVKTKEVAKALKHAAGFGDFSENAAYDQAKEAKAFLRGRIMELEKMLLNAQVIEKTQGSTIVEMGSTVTIEANGEQETIQVVGQEEADPLNGKISFNSPLGAKLRHKHRDDEATISTPNGPLTYKILKIE